MNRVLHLNNNEIFRSTHHNSIRKKKQKEKQTAYSGQKPHTNSIQFILRNQMTLNNFNIVFFSFVLGLNVDCQPENIQHTNAWNNEKII